ncbi:MAG TPA: SWIM zinc finger family protein [Anaerolineaceae bacterium]
MPRRKYSYYRQSFTPKPRAIHTNKGIKARSQSGDFNLHWWATRWINAMERLMDSRRLTRGRTYARQGQVLSIEEKNGGIEAKVQGSRSKPYRVKIEVAPLNDKAWEKVVQILASQALYIAELLAGEMPANIEDAFTAAGVSLFPARGELHTECTCPDWANPCKHVAATHYILAERFDEDPFLLLRLRGRSQEEILRAIRQHRAGLPADAALNAPAVETEEDEEEEAEQITPLEAQIEQFWSLGQPLDNFQVIMKPPAIEMALLKRLGDPTYLMGDSLQKLVQPAYQAISQAALAAAFADSGESEPQDTNGKNNGKKKGGSNGNGNGSHE